MATTRKRSAAVPTFKPTHRIITFYPGETEYAPVMLHADGTAPCHRDWADNRPGDWTCIDGTWLHKGQPMPEGAINFRVDLVSAAPWCEPYEAGLSSEASAVGKRLGELLTALGGLDHIVNGTLPRELWEYRIQLHERLKAEGWRISQKGQSGWKVLPPKR